VSGASGQSKQRERKPIPVSNANVAAQSPRAAMTARAASSTSGFDASVAFAGKHSLRNAMSDSVVVCSAYSMVTPLLSVSKGTLE
jgi:hypothetical protein